MCQTCLASRRAREVVAALSKSPKRRACAKTGRSRFGGGESRSRATVRAIARHWTPKNAAPRPLCRRRGGGRSGRARGRRVAAETRAHARAVGQIPKGRERLRADDHRLRVRRVRGRHDRERDRDAGRVRFRARDAAHESKSSLATDISADGSRRRRGCDVDITWGDGSRRRRGCDVDFPRGDGSRRRRGCDVDVPRTGRGDAAAATWILRGETGRGDAAADTRFQNSRPQAREGSSRRSPSSNGDRTRARSSSGSSSRPGTSGRVEMLSIGPSFATAFKRTTTAVQRNFIGNGLHLSKWVSLAGTSPAL